MADPQPSDETRVTLLRGKVNQLADQLHRAKQQLDWTQYNWLGLDRGERDVWRRFANGPMKLELDAKHRSYRRAWHAYWEARKELDMLTWEDATEQAVAEARRHMNERFGPRLVEAAGTTGAFDLSEHPEIARELEQSLAEAAAAMKRSPSEQTITYLVETMAAAQEAGYSGTGEYREDARKAAARLVEEARTWDHQRRDQRSRFIGRLVLHQWLGG